MDHSVCDEEMANWEELPKEILEVIAGRLVIEDFLAFGWVCKSWQSAATKEIYKAKSKALWLMTYRCNHIAEFSSLSTGRIYPAQLPGVPAVTLSALGWIIVPNGGSEYRIFNPLSRVSIKLPALEKIHNKSRLSAEHNGLERLQIEMMALSSSPSLSGSYTVMITYSRYPGFAFHRSGEHAWTAVSLPTQLRENIFQLIYYDGLFVALDWHNQILTLKARKRRMRLRLVLQLQDEEGRAYLVECSGKLLVVWTILAGWYDKDSDNPIEIRVFEIDLEKGTQKELKSLGNASLFLNGNSVLLDGNSPFCNGCSSFSVEFKAESCLPGIKPNRVYFPDYVAKEIKSYSMEDGSFETYLDATGSPVYGAKWFQPDF